MAGRQTKRKIASKETRKDTSTQTTPDKRDVEIIRLKESMKVLEENLRRFVRNGSNIEPGLRNISTRRTLESIDSASVAESPNSKKMSGKGCNCKGKCANKVCGCVKRNIPCGEFCRCNDSRCQNQEPDKENIGDPISQSKLSADGEQALQSLAVLTLRQDQQMQAAVQVAGLSNNQLNAAGKSLFSPDNNFPSPETELSLSVLDINDVMEFGNVKKNIQFDSDTSLNEEEASKEQKPNYLNIPDEKSKAQVGERPSSDKSKKRKLLSPFYNGRKQRASSCDVNREKSKSPVRNVAVEKRGKVKPNDEVSSTQDAHSSQIAAKLENFDDELEFSSINPMKPTRQLPRTPVRGSPPNDQLQLSEASVSTSEQDSTEKLSPSSEDNKKFTSEPSGKQDQNILREYRIYPTLRPSLSSSIEAPIVDWEEHCAQLVPCKLCRRKFYPHRLPKHEASCKKL